MKMKGNLISLTSLIFIVLVGMAMTGCATPLMNAAAEGNINAIKDLLDKGADVNEKGPLGESVLFWAAYKGQTGAVRLLIDKGADINAKDSEGRTPLWMAAVNGRDTTVKLLVDKGADPTISAFGRTPLEAARHYNKTTMADILAKAEERYYGLTKDEKTLPVVSNVENKPEVKSLKSDIDELPAIKAKPNKSSYAIVIGIEQYRQKLPKADYAVADAKIMTEYLTKVMGYLEENVVTLTNDRASLTDFIKYFEKWLPNNVEKDSSVFIYYSGHGAPNPKTGDAYLVPYDGDPSFIDETGYSLKRLYESLGKLHTKEIIVALDSCFSGAGGRSVIAKGARPLVMNLESSFILSQKIAVLSAASGEQISSTYEEKGHGLFTYFMLKGLKGEGDTNGDGKVEIGELFEYLKPQVERIARKTYNNEQLPQLIAPAETIRQKLIER